MHSIPTLDELNILLTNNKETIKYLNDNNVFYDTLLCDVCHREMKKLIEKEVFKCCSKTYGNRQKSLKNHTFFFGSNLTPFLILKLAHLWLSNVSFTFAVILSGHSPNTISNFYAHFRQLVTSSLQIEDQIIGGQDIIVEVDETKLGKRKYHRGHRVDGV